MTSSASPFSARAIVSELAALCSGAWKSAAQIRRDVPRCGRRRRKIYAEKGHDEVAVAVQARLFPFPEGSN